MRLYADDFRQASDQTLPYSLALPRQASRPELPLERLSRATNATINLSLRPARPRTWRHVLLLLGLFAFGPRVVLALEWIFGHRIQHAFAHWWWPLLGLIFFPWTTLMSTIVWTAGGVHGANWIAVALGVVLDVISYSSRKAQQMYRARGAAF